jgi:sugar phosphate isomerase/epimerase
MKYSVTSVILPELDLVEQCELLRGCGYDGLELRVRRVPDAQRDKPFSMWGRHKNDLGPQDFPRRAAEIRQIAGDHGLVIPAIAANAPCDALEDVKWLAEGAAGVGGAMLRLGTPSHLTKEMDYHSRFGEAVEAYGRAIEITAGFGIRVLIEIHAGTIHCSPSLAWRIARNWPVSQIGVIFDLNNMTKVGWEEADLGLQILGPYTAHVHCGAWEVARGQARPDGSAAWTWQGCDVGQGLLDLPEAFAALHRHGYRGFVSLEDFRGIDPQAKCRQAIDYFRRIDPDRP